MKMTAHVLSVTDQGERLLITAQGMTEGAADWRPWERLEFTMPLTDKSRRAFYVGRKMKISVSPA